MEVKKKFSGVYQVGIFQKKKVETTYVTPEWEVSNKPQKGGSVGTKGIVLSNPLNKAWSRVRNEGKRGNLALCSQGAERKPRPYAYKRGRRHPLEIGNDLSGEGKRPYGQPTFRVFGRERELKKRDLAEKNKERG